MTKTPPPKAKTPPIRPPKVEAQPSIKKTILMMTEDQYAGLVKHLESVRDTNSSNLREFDSSCLGRILRSLKGTP